MNHERTAVLFVVLTTVLLSAGCLDEGSQDEAVEISISGSTTVLPICKRSADLYMNEHPNVRITIEGGGSSVGIQDAIAGSVDIGMSSREIKTEEKASGLYDIKIALDGLAVIVHPDNPISILGSEEIRDIYLGNLKNWSEVGGGNGTIIIVGRDNRSGTRASFDELVLDKAPPHPSMIERSSNGFVLDYVKSNPLAIGYIGLGYLTGEVKAVKVDGVAPSEQTVIAGSYPVSRSLYFVTMGEPSGEAKRFIDFVKGIEGQTIVEEEGFVPLK